MANREFQGIVNTLRSFRSLHRWIGITAAVFMVVTASTGILLGWKKNVDLLQPPTAKGISQQMEGWISFAEVARHASLAMDSIGLPSATLDRMDVRPDKGIVKVLFVEGYWEVQVDATNGAILSVAQRHSDWIEHLHDGSIISDSFKLLYTNYLGWSLLGLTATGFGLWYGPRLIRQRKKEHSPG